MKKSIFLSICLLAAASALSVSAQPASGDKPFRGRFNNLLFEDRLAGVKDTGSVFKVGGEWFPFPAYEDRDAWEELSKDCKPAVLKKAEAALHNPWQPIPPSVYLEFEKTGNRGLMKNESNNFLYLNALICGELVEGRGRFLKEIMDRCYLMCIQPTWSHAAHSGRQPGRRTLPDGEHYAVTLHSSYVAAIIAVGWHYFHELWDEQDPSVSKFVQKTMKERIFDPYMSDWYAENFHPWMGYAKQSHAINNWNPTCNTGVLIASLLMIQDQKELDAMIARLFYSMDSYLSYIFQDGCCDEGPSYWRMASGKFYEFSRVVCDASQGKINVFDDPFLHRACEYKSKTDLGDGWVVDYGDGGARDSGDPMLLFRIGTDLGNKEIIDYAIYNSTYPEEQKFKVGGFPSQEAMTGLEFIRYRTRFKEAQKEALEACGGDYYVLKKELRKKVASVWYDQTQQAVMRPGGGWTLACKAGSNDESHNHCDCGSCILFVDDCPVFIDPGTATYGKDTFGPGRYKMWHIRSASHNVPMINGCEQIPGKHYTKDVACDLEKNTLTADLAGVYPEDAAVNSWVRTYSVSRGNLTITDAYDLSARKAPDCLRFTVQGEVKVSGGFITIKAHSFDGKKEVMVKLRFPKGMKATVEEKKLEDAKLSRTWGESLRTIVLTSPANAPLKGVYVVQVTK